MTESIRDSIYEAIASIRLIDPHTHINPHSPASNTIADLLGYHYYTELAHSAGMPKYQIEEPGLQPRELVSRLVNNLSPIENTAQYRWLIEICRMFFGFEGDRIDDSNWEEIYDTAENQMASAEWPQMVLDQSNVEAVFLTNDFDDDLDGFDTDTYIPCLRTDDLVFHLEKPITRQRLEACSGVQLDGSLNSLRQALNQRFEHFVSRGARACAISLPPTFEPMPVTDGRASTALDHVLRQGANADPSHKSALSRRVFWTLAELCDEYGLPFDLMIGVNRGVYVDGVYQGQDLYDSRVSLIQYKELFNAFPAVKFPISVLASVTNQELVSYAWIFPNVITNGHWWYSNTPSFIARDAAARLEAVPQTKQIGYYSDAYKLEFVWPKFDMYRHILSGILADHFVKGCGWSEERAIELGRQVLRDNVDAIFPKPAGAGPEASADTSPETWLEDTPADDPALDAASAAAVAAAIEMDHDEPAAEQSGGFDLSGLGTLGVAEAEADDLEEPEYDAPGYEEAENDTSAYEEQEYEQPEEGPALTLGAAEQDEMDTDSEETVQLDDELEEMPTLGMDEGEQDNWDGMHADEDVDEGEREEIAALGLVSVDSEEEAEATAETESEDDEINELDALGLVEPGVAADQDGDEDVEEKSEDELAALGLEVAEPDDFGAEEAADEAAAEAAEEAVEESADELAALGLEDAEVSDWSEDEEPAPPTDELPDDLAALGLADVEASEASGVVDFDPTEAEDTEEEDEEEDDENELAAFGLDDLEGGPEVVADDEATESEDDAAAEVEGAMLSALGLEETGVVDEDSQDDEQVSELDLDVGSDESWDDDEAEEAADEEFEESDDELADASSEAADEVGWSVDSEDEQEEAEAEEDDPSEWDLGEADDDAAADQAEPSVGFELTEEAIDEEPDDDEEPEDDEEPWVNLGPAVEEGAEESADESGEASIDFEEEGEEEEADDNWFDDSEDEQESVALDEVEDDEAEDDEGEADEQYELDPAPSVEEIQAVGIEDVELQDFSAEREAPDAAALEAELDSEPLNLDEMLGDDEEEGHAEIRQFRAEESFEIGDESLQVEPDPLTGELIMPTPTDDDADDEPLVMEDPADVPDSGEDFLAEVEETLMADDSDPLDQDGDDDLDFDDDEIEER